MKTVQAVLAYAVAGLMGPLMVVGFLMTGVPGLDEAIVAATGLTLSAEIDGGEIVRTVDHGTYRTEVHRMAFDALIGERKEGFIQVDWAPLDALPARIDEEIDADDDGQADLRLEVDTTNQQSTLTPYAPWVTGLEGTYERKQSLAVRVHLRNPSR